MKKDSLINKYSEFSEGFILDKMIKESIFYYSPDIRKILAKLSPKNAIAKDIMSIETEDIKPDITFIDLDTEGFLSFSTMRNAKKIITDKFPNLDYVDVKPDVDMADSLWELDKSGNGSGLFKKSRNPLAIGKLVNKLFPKKYSDKEREEFVNLFKSTIGKEAERFEIVDGDLIPFWYRKENYKEVSGNLGNSCMRDKSASTFDLYAKNPDICKMVILLDDDELIGRALIWKVTKYKKNGREIESPEWFMDRQYTIKESDVTKFRKFADDKGWAYKTNNNHHSLSSITWKGESFSVNMTIQLPKNGSNYGYGRYPYMDTFKRFDIDNGTLHNDDEEDNYGHYLLDDTDGGYTETTGGVWSEWHGENIPEERSVWSDWADSYLWDNRCVEVTSGNRRNRGYYPDDCEDIVFDEWNNESIHQDDAVYSESYGYYILYDEATRVLSKVYSDGSCDEYGDSGWVHREDDYIISKSDIEDRLWYRILSEKYEDWLDYENIDSRILEKDYKDDLILKKMKIETYRVEDALDGSDSMDLDGVEYLTKIDAKILGWNLDISDFRKTDQFDYHEEIKILIPILEEKLKQEIKKVEGILMGKNDDELPLEFDEESVENSKSMANRVINPLKDRLLEIKMYSE